MEEDKEPSGLPLSSTPSLPEIQGRAANVKSRTLSPPAHGSEVASGVMMV